MLIVGFIVWLAYDLTVIVLYRLAVSQIFPRENIDFPSQQLLRGVIVGLSIGFFFGQLNGGIACIKHVLLRVFLWRAEVLPWNYVRFLDYAAERILLRKVGGGYIFVHRLLLEYFAALAAFFTEEAPAVSAISDPPPVLSSTFQIDTVPREEKASLPVPRRRTGFNKEKRIVVLLVVVLLLELSFGSSIIGIVQRAAQNTNDAVATAQTKSYDTAATATAQAWATANVSVIAANPNPYGGGTLVLYDPLSQPNQWYNNSNDSWGGACQFTNGTYRISQSKPNRTYICSVTLDFSNFAFEVKMKIIKGDCGGIDLRDDGSHRKDYLFEVCQSGYYSLYRYTENNKATSLISNFSSAFSTRWNHSNKIAVMANGSTFYLYVNNQKIDTVSDSTYSHGQIGLLVNDTNNPTEVEFSNARVWTL